jgi:SSS family solute:Na+ symporter
MMMSSNIDGAMVIGYIIIMFITGIVIYKKGRNYDDYLIAGRKFNAFFIAITLTAMISSATLGVAGLGYSFGLSGAWFFIMLGIGAWILLFTVAGRLRVLAQYSITDIFELRYDHRARIAIAIMGTLAYICLMSIGFVGGGRVIQSIFDIRLFPAMLIMAIPFIAYTALGGLWASAITNVIKFIILSAGLLVLIPTAISRGGGWHNLTAALPSGTFNMFSSDAMLFVWAFFWVMTLSMWVAADIYQMLFSARSVRTAKVGLGFAGFLMILIGLAAAFIGLSSSVIFPNIDPEAAIPTLASTLAPGLRGFVAIAMLGGSAIAVVIFQIVSSTLLVRGLWPKTKISLNRIRLLSALVGVTGLIFAGLLPNIIDLTELTFRIIIPATFLPVLASFYWKRATATGALASSISGASVSALWTFLALPNLSVTLQSILEPAFIGVLASGIGLVAGSYLSAEPAAEKVKTLARQQPVLPKASTSTADGGS